MSSSEKVENVVRLPQKPVARIKYHEEFKKSLSNQLNTNPSKKHPIRLTESVGNHFMLPWLMMSEKYQRSDAPSPPPKKTSSNCFIYSIGK